MNTQTVANGVATELFETEQAINLALAKATKLFETVMLASGQLDLSVGAGQPSVRRLAGTITSLSDARGAITAVHGSLQHLGDKVGIEPIAGGGGYKPGDSPDVFTMSGEHAKAG